MGHTHYCHTESCSNTAPLKCSRCLTVRYCSEACQRLDWRHHRETCCSLGHAILKQELFERIQQRMGREGFLYEHFEGFMANHAHLYAPRSLHEWMEDWISGWWNKERERKEQLRSLFRSAGRAWCPEMHGLYEMWSAGRPGTRSERMAAFLEITQGLR